MTLTRIYIPLNASGLQRLDADRVVAPAPFFAHAVTDALKESASSAGQDEWEYAALSDAVQSSAALLTAGETRRIVAAADVLPEFVGSLDLHNLGSDLTVDSVVSISDSVSIKRIASFHVDDDDADEDDELLWYDVTELPVILALL